MNRRLLSDMEGSTWNESEINRRSKQLADYVIKIWPHADALRRELRIAPRDGADCHAASGIPPATARQLVDAVTDYGIQGNWLDIKGLNRRRREGCYGRYVRIGSRGRRHVAWFGVGKSHQALVLDYSASEGRDGHQQVILLPDDDFYEMLQVATEQVREISHSISQYN